MEPILRKKTREIKIGNVRIGSGNPICVQSMTNTDTRNVPATLAQIERLAAAGCEVVRLAVLNEDAASAIRHISAASPLPLVADIHFDARLAVAALKNGVDALRINPGNIGSRAKVAEVVAAARDKGAPIRIGVNSGSVEKEILRKYGGPTPEALVESALGHVRILEELDFFDIKISIKSSSVLDTIAGYTRLSAACDYPLHLGVTEAGTAVRGAVKSSIGIGLLLWQGIGDTLRVSLTADPVEEIPVAWEILRALGLRCRGPEIISCPTCGRTEVDLIGLAEKVEKRLEGESAPIKVAVMGCVVNGPGEAREADIGLAGGRGKGIIFRHGEIVRKAGSEQELLDAFMEELDLLLKEKRG
ncbi:MAG: flavodoxin-dependent (E)-4-hydroxy-3-methylbut-2-enyl-diphosphate synthase [Desulfovibrionaceae bacterium]|nr:flavodoxin-dependent (E)-4-hydroxy-3-methylbut-2-enyl-diphosphate synthase [Desulfovibrionaceae bacterium]